MKVLLASTLLTGALVAQEAESPEIPNADKERVHFVSPKVFYRYHDEMGYKYETYGAGIEYSLIRASGANVRISTITDGKKDRAFIESEQTLFFRMPLSNSHILFPTLSSKVSTHQIGKEKTEDSTQNYYINKSTVFAGFGYEYNWLDDFRFRAEILGFRDLHNAIHVNQNDTFWGRAYSNPFGLKGKIGVLAKWKDRIFLDLEGFYAKTFDKCYTEMGCEVAFKWGF